MPSLWCLPELALEHTRVRQSAFPEILADRVLILGASEPAVKLLEFFRHKYASSSVMRQPHFHTQREGTMIDEALVAKFVRHWNKVCWQ